VALDKFLNNGQPCADAAAKFLAAMQPFEHAEDLVEVALLNAEVVTILAQADVRDSLQKQGLNPVTGTPEELGKLVESDLERWTKVVRAARISAD